MKFFRETLLFVLLLLWGCDDVVTKKIVNVQEDNLSPKIIIESPKQNSEYSSKVNMKVNVTDDSLVDGDSKGILKRFSFEVRGESKDFSGAVNLLYNSGK